MKGIATIEVRAWLRTKSSLPALANLFAEYYRTHSADLAAMLEAAENNDPSALICKNAWVVELTALRLKE